MLVVEVLAGEYVPIVAAPPELTVIFAPGADVPVTLRLPKLLTVTLAPDTGVNVGVVSVPVIESVAVAAGIDEVVALMSPPELMVVVPVAGANVGVFIVPLTFKAPSGVDEVETVIVPVAPIVVVDAATELN